MNIKKHEMEYPRRDNVSHIRHWQADYAAVSALAMALGYPEVREQTAPRGSVLPVREKPRGGPVVGTGVHD